MSNKYKILWTIAVTAVAVSCADLDEPLHSSLQSKPEDTSKSEYLQSFAELKSYIDRTASPDFKLGMGITLANFTQPGIMRSIAATNFDEVTPTDAFVLGGILKSDGTMDYSTVLSAVDAAAATQTSLYGSALVWHKNQNAAYFKTMFTPIVIPPKNEEGSDIGVVDFNSYTVGDELPMTPATNTGKAIVIDDPTGGGYGKVLHMGEGGNVAQKFPQIPITLPGGRVLGNYIRIKINAYFVEGQYGSGMRVGINDGDLVNPGGNAVDLGAGVKQWKTMSIDVSKLNLTDEQKALTNFTLTVGSATGGGNYYYASIDMDWAISEMGDDMIADFESNTLGDAYEVTGNGQAIVENDPKGVSGKVIHLGTPTVPLAQSFLKIPVTLTTGRKLGDYEYVTLDMNAPGSGGLYGSGMRMGINDNELKTYGSPSSFGCPDGNWGRGAIQLMIVDLGLTDAEKKLTSFTLVIGSGTGSGNYYMDNIRMHWKGTDKYIEMTPEEKKDTLLHILDSYIGGMMTAVDGKVTSWTAINEPMDDTNPTELKSDLAGAEADNFYWQDYIGRDYARDVVRMTRAGAQNLKLYVNDYGLESNAAKCDGLIAMIDYWESDGTTRFDGIGTEMLLTYSLSAATQTANESGVEAMFTKLAATGKLIRISQLEIGIADENGTAITTPTFDQQLMMAEYYRFVIKKYLELVPAAQRTGITFGNPVNAAKGLWNAAYNRMPTYSGVTEGLSNK